MANASLTPSGTFPAGTSVSAYAATDWPGTTVPSGAPPGSAAATATVQADGSLTFTGLVEDRTYWAAAQVSGVWRYVRFRAGSDAAAGTVEVSTVDGGQATIGSTTDAEAASGNGSLIALQKRVRTLLAGGLPAALTGSGSLKVANVEAIAAGANRIGEVVSPSQWSQSHAPAAATQATTTKAAGGAGVRHYCNALVVTLSNSAAAAGDVVIRLRDGATGAGTILAEFRLAIPAVASSFAQVALSDLEIIGTANTAMTLETSGAPQASCLASVTLVGRTV